MTAVLSGYGCTDHITATCGGWTQAYRRVPGHNERKEETMMTRFQEGLILFLMCLSAMILVIPALIFGIRRVFVKNERKVHKKTGISRMFAFSLCLTGSVWCLRYAVGYFAILSSNTPELMLTWWEEIFNSMAHVLQTFSMDEDYKEYIINGKRILREILGQDTPWQTVYGLYASILNFVAPIAGGAIIFEILASIFPKIKLSLSYIAVWKEKYYFSEFNKASLALAKSITEAKAPWFRKPVLIFTDAYVDDENEKSAEMMLEAKWIGAICIRDDLSHVRKNKYGSRKFFLIDRMESSNLHTLVDLANERNASCLKKAEIYLFTNDDAYVQVESSVKDRLLLDRDFREEELPVFVPVQSYRNLISNLLVDIPLYEPLIGKKRNQDGSQDLTVTILGTGHIGTEMFLSTYWFGQILNCNLKINVLSQETEKAFWSKIDYINPEIKQTTLEGNPILRINQKGDFAPVYCQVNYMQCDVKSSAFVSALAEKESPILETDYFLVALGADEENISVANTVRKFVGQHHISGNSNGRAVIAYVVYDSELTSTLNRKKHFRYVDQRTDVYMCAIGSRQDVYSVRNVFLTEHESAAQRVSDTYLAIKNREQRALAHKERMQDDYKHWANLARGMHIRYKMYSMGLVKDSLLDVEDPADERYTKAMEEAHNRYKAIAKGDITFGDDREAEKHLGLLHEMAWLEHRRWNAFTRVKGFRHTEHYKTYAKPKEKGSYKHMDLKLHPCLVECDKKGIRAVMLPTGQIDESTALRCEDNADLDRLDELSYDLYKKKLNGYNFKQYDYPSADF